MTWAEVLGACFSGDGDRDDHAKNTRNYKGERTKRPHRRPTSTNSAAGRRDKKNNNTVTIANDKQTRSMQKFRLSFSETLLSDHPAGSPEFAENLSVSLGSNVCTFTARELRSVTNNFSFSHLLGEGGFGKVYKGFLNEKLRPGVLEPQTVAVKLLDLQGRQGHKEWLAEVIYMGQLDHPHVVRLIGYCCQEEQRMLVYQFMERGSLENHLFKRFYTSLPWATRLKIAVGAAKGLAFLHGLDKPIIYRDFKASNILLDSDFTAKLSDFGLAKDGPEGEETHVSASLMGTHGYAAPEYVKTGHLTSKSDVYSYGVVLLELLTGLRSMDKKRSGRKQDLVEWTRPYLNDGRKLHRIMDPRLEGHYSPKGVQGAAALAFQCLSHHPTSRPDMNTVVKMLEPLQQLQDVAIAHFVYVVDQDSPPENDKAAVPLPKNKEERHSRHTRNGRHSHRNRSPISVIQATTCSSNSDESPCRKSPCSPRCKSRSSWPEMKTVSPLPARR